MADKKQYEIAVDEYEIADAAYQKLQEYVETGGFLVEVLQRSAGNPATAVELWGTVWDRLRALKDDRNAKLRAAKDSLRQAVSLEVSQERGPEGRATIVKYGDFQVSSVTRRFFDPQSLVSLCERFKVLDDLLKVTTTGRSGSDEPIVSREWKINYEKTYEWLKTRSLTTIVDGAYDESESTPMVKGPKEIAFLGDKKGD